MREASLWTRPDDAYFVGEIYTLQELSVWFFAGKGLFSIERETEVFLRFCEQGRLDYCIAIGVREGILLGKRKNFALKVTFSVYSEWGLKPLVYLFYTVEFVYNGFACNVNSPITLHFVRSR